MRLTEKYILDYTKDFVFDFTTHIALRVLDVDIEIDVFEYAAQQSRREKAHAIFTKGNLRYECDFCDQHDYENDFYPITLNGQRFICFRKTLYGFTLLNADTLSVEFEYFPECVLDGEESFIVVDVKQLDNLLIFEGCYWACPYECFAFDYDKKLFLNVSEMCGLTSLEETATQDNKLILYGTDQKDADVQRVVSAEDLRITLTQHGKTDM